MSNDLVMFERALEPVIPKLRQLCEPMGVDANRIARTALISIERTPKLMQCSVQSVINSCVTAAVAGLVVDGWSGQGFLIPYNVKGTDTAQFQIGARGFPTIAARSGFSCNSGAVYEADEFDFDLGSDPYVRHRPSFRQDRGRLIAAYAVFKAKNMPPIINVSGLDDLLMVKKKSQGAARRESPWNDMTGPGFPGMCVKTAIRRAGKNVPIVELQRVVSLDDAHEERGIRAHFRVDGSLAVDDDEGAFPERSAAVDDVPTRRPDYIITVRQNGMDTDRRVATIEDWFTKMSIGIDGLKNLDQLEAFTDRNRQNVMALEDEHPDQVRALNSRLEARRRALSESGPVGAAKGETATSAPPAAKDDANSPAWYVDKLVELIPQQTSAAMIDQMLAANAAYIDQAEPALRSILEATVAARRAELEVLL